jgi:uncharacterized protein YjbI with pentapeptide repeats/adenylate kinase family enzyme
MSNLSTGVIATKNQPITGFLPKIDAKAFGTSVAKGVAHFFLGKLDDLADDAIDAAASLGLKDNSPEALAYSLLQKSLSAAIFELLQESQILIFEETKLNAFQNLVEEKIQDIEVNLDFLKNPLKSKFSTVFIDPLIIWLERLGQTKSAATTISNRLPGCIPYALHKEWSKNPQKYEPLLKTIISPFSEAAENEGSWMLYKAKLHAKLEESIFGEPFGLRQIYIPLNAVYEEKTCKKTGLEADTKKHVVSLIDELDSWIDEENSPLTIRTISGGPGSGKSSFSKIYAAHAFETKGIKTIFIPLHFIDPTRDFSEEIGRYVKDEGLLKYNPIAKENLTERLLIILDGLDELASQGQAAALTAKNFVRSVQQTVDRLNMQKCLIKVLFSGREVVIQNNETEFRLSGQVLTILPYHVSDTIKASYTDPNKLLEQNLSELWWKNYGTLIGKPFSGLPEDLKREDLEEITAQPLLNYLLALSYCRGKLNFNIGVNLNEIYSDLVEAIYERGYEKGRRHESIRSIEFPSFLLILEEIGLAAWHGDGRTTTVSEIEYYCREGGFSDELDAFQDGAKAGITSLLAAFFFRQHGSRPKGDPAFIFTHKSFGEYLAARRITRAIRDIIEERARRDSIARGRGRGWGDQECLKHWAEICGPTGLSPNILNFLRAEIRLMDSNDCEEAQTCLTNLFNFLIKSAMPMEKLTALPNFETAMFQARNAEEALLASLNACARRNKKICDIQHPSQTTFGTWLKRIQEQRNGPQSALVTECLSWLNLNNTCFDFADLWGADISHSTFNKARGYRIVLSSALAIKTDLTQCAFEKGFFTHSDFTDSNFEDGSLYNSDFTSCTFGKSNFRNTKLAQADFKGARISECDFTGSDRPKGKSRRK